MRFVDGKQRQAVAGPHALQRPHEPFGHQALGSHVEQIQLSREQAPLHLARGMRILAGIQERRPHAQLQERIDLVLHQRYERRNHDPHALAQQGGDLVADGLAAAGGHQHQGIATRAHVRDDLRLCAAKGRVPEDRLQQLDGGGHAGQAASA